MSRLAHWPILGEIGRWILRLTIVRACLRSWQAIRHDLWCPLNRGHVRGAIHLIVPSQPGNKCFRGRIVEIFCLLAHAIVTLVLQSTFDTSQAWPLIACGSFVSWHALHIDPTHRMAALGPYRTSDGHVGTRNTLVVPSFYGGEMGPWSWTWKTGCRYYYHCHPWMATSLQSMRVLPWSRFPLP